MKPVKRRTSKDLTFCALFAALLAALAQISIPIPGSPVPFSLCIIGVFLCGGLLSVKNSVLSMLTYLLLGTIGVPVFSQLGAGVGKLAGPTGGYLFSYPLMVFIISGLLGWYYKKRKRQHSILELFCYMGSMLLGLLACYIIGTIWFVLISGASIFTALSGCVFPFIPLDLVKVILSSLLCMALRKRLPRLFPMTGCMQ